MITIYIHLFLYFVRLVIFCMAQCQKYFILFFLQLISSNAISQTKLCYDTFKRFLLANDSLNYYSNNTLPTSDGNLLLCGQYAKKSFPYANGGFLMKFDYNGNLLWQKLYDSVNHPRNHWLYYYRALELQDKTILLTGETKNLNTGNDDLIITKTDNRGNIIWSKIYNSRLWGFGDGSADYFYVVQMKQDTLTGDVFITGPFWTSGCALVRFNPTTANIVWSKAYQSGGDFNAPFGLDILPNEI